MDMQHLISNNIIIELLQHQEVSAQWDQEVEIATIGPLLTSL